MNLKIVLEEMKGLSENLKDNVVNTPNELTLAKNESEAGGVNVIYKNKAEKIILQDAQPFYCPEEVEVETLTYSRNFGSTNFQALYVPFKMCYADWCDYADVYRINAYYESDTDGDGVVDKKELGLIRVKESHGYLYPNHPYIIKPKATGPMDLTLENTTLYPSEHNFIDCSTVDTRFVFTGTYQTKTNLLSDGCYFLSGSKICYAPDDETELKGFRWYMQYDDRGGQFIPQPSNIGLRIEGGTTDIEEIVGIEDIEVVTIFNLDGKTVNPNSVGRGLFIKNGKKIYIK